MMPRPRNPKEEERLRQLRLLQVAARLRAERAGIRPPLPTAPRIAPGARLTPEDIARLLEGVPEGEYYPGGDFMAPVKPLTRPLVTPEMVRRLPGPVQPIGRAARELTSPVQIGLMAATAGLGPSVAAGLAGRGLAGRVAAGAVSPIVRGGFPARLAAEAALGTGAAAASMETARRIPETAPLPVRIGAPLAAGLVGGAGAVGATRALVRGAPQAARAVTPTLKTMAREERGGALPRGLSAKVGQEADQIEQLTRMLAKKGRLPEGLNRQVAEAQLGFLEARQRQAGAIRDAGSTEQALNLLRPELEAVQLELNARSAPFHAGVKNTLFQGQSTFRLDAYQTELSQFIKAVEGAGPRLKGAGPSSQTGVMQAGMGIGERSAQGGLFENLPAQGGAAPLIDRVGLEARAARQAEVARGQTEMLAKPGATRPPVRAGAESAVAKVAPEVAVPTGPARAPQPAAATRGIPPQAAVPGQVSVAQGQGPPPVKPPVDISPPSGKPEEPFAANIRLSKYPEELRGEIKAWADAHTEEVQAARRGVRSDAQVQADARSLAQEIGLKHWKAGEAWNAEELTAIRGLLRQKTTRVMEAAQAARVENSSQNQAALLLGLQEQARVQQTVHGVTAEAGRALRSFRQDVIDIGKASTPEKWQVLLKRYGGKITPDRLDEVAERLTQLDIDNPLEVNSFIRSLQKPGPWDYITELYYNSILSGPKTHIINSLSNTATMMGSSLERGVAAGVEKIVAPLQKRRAERFFDEVPADLFGAIEGLDEGVRASVRTMMSGISPKQATKWEFRPHAFKGKVGRVINVPSTGLEAADALFQAMNYRAALNATILRRARTQGLRGQALKERIAEWKVEPPEDIIATAAKQAEYRLFRNEPGKLVETIIRARDTVPVLRFLLPFLRTPTNLLKFGLARSPFGWLNPGMWKNLAKKSPEFSDQAGRALLGSMVAGVLAWRIQKGDIEITGPVPDNAAERDRFYREGKLPYAVKVGPYWIQYQRLEPFNQTLSLVAAATRAIEDGDKDASEKAAAAAQEVGENFVSQTYMSQVALTLDWLRGRTSQDPFSRAATALVTPFSALLRTAAQVIDPKVREPEGFVEKIKSGVPGLSRSVPSRLTAFGEEAQRRGPQWSPISVSREEQSAVDVELERLKVNIGLVGDSVSGVPLNREEQRQYQAVAGQQTYRDLVSLLGEASYQRSNDASKERSIRRIVDDAREAARDVIFWQAKGVPVGEWQKDMAAYYRIPGNEMERKAKKAQFPKSRDDYLKSNPKVDAMVYILGKRESLQKKKGGFGGVASDAVARGWVVRLMREYGIKPEDVPGLQEKEYESDNRKKLRLAITRALKALEGQPAPAATPLPTPSPAPPAGQGLGKVPPWEAKTPVQTPTPAGQGLGKVPPWSTRVPAGAR